RCYPRLRQKPLKHAAPLMSGKSRRDAVWSIVGVLRVDSHQSHYSATSAHPPDVTARGQGGRLVLPIRVASGLPLHGASEGGPRSRARLLSLANAARFQGECPPSQPSDVTMNVHEYQAKGIFRSYGIPVPAGKVAASPEEAVEAARELGGSVWVVK